MCCTYYSYQCKIILVDLIYNYSTVLDYSRSFILKRTNNAWVSSVTPSEKLNTLNGQRVYFQSLARINTVLPGKAFSRIMGHLGAANHYLKTME